MESSILYAVISGVGLVQGLLFAFLLLAKKEKQRPDRILCIWFLVFTLHLLSGLVGEYYPNQHLFTVLTATMGFLHGPFFLIYNKSLFAKHRGFIDSIHFLPFLIFTVLGLFVGADFTSSWDLVILFPKIASLILYPTYVWYSCSNQTRFLQNNHSGHEVIALRWIRIITILFLVSIGISLLRMVVELSVGVRYFELWDVSRYVILLTALGYFGLRYGMVFSPEMMVQNESKKNYRNSPLKELDKKDIAKTIIDFINRDEPYLNPNFSLSMLSESIKIPKHHLSQIINSEMKTTFYSLINSKRVEYAIAKLKISNTINETLEGIGYDSGFNSKSAFFHNFKKVTGKTPKQYLKEISSS